MADNVQAGLPVGAGPIFKSEDDGTAHWLISKIAWGLASVRNLIGTGADALPIQDGGNAITIDAVSLPLPTGAATDTKQDTGNTSLASIDGKTATLVGGLVPITASTLPLPTGAATSASQTTGNTSLSSIDSKLPSVLVSDRLKVDGSGVTQPVSAATLPLPAGAATESTLSNVNTALQGTLTVTGVVAQTIAANVLATVPLYSDGDVESLVLNPSGELLTTSKMSAVDRINQEWQILQSIQQSLSNAGTMERYNSNRRGFELR